MTPTIFEFFWIYSTYVAAAAVPWKSGAPELLYVLRNLFSFSLQLITQTKEYRIFPEFNLSCDVKYEYLKKLPCGKQIE